MKYLILIIGYIIIGILFREDLKETHAYYNINISIIIPIFFWLIWTVIWLILFFVADIEIPLYLKWKG